MVSEPQKATIFKAGCGSNKYHPRGRRARHVMKVEMGTAGGPNRPSRKGVSINKYKSEEIEKTIRKSVRP
jgi:hypothetical protein